ncbi:uncharacterized protein YlxW (UPF0749 family) [Allocatelliglobosispora scoriae]|uniref:Uncharacterized protein YlxW (UPF0749 family) n=1 Tax=Allocatelliglobosispora scoriae TaxID=643052 RepID=A0A841C413_9ACTN|nr:DUF881 domain-containing protein [Allocatelliglobosispora scoriae]MBB5874049.1 uncharacterized protein YlxW (UPF0749 family) [Allocatelliglobosispora scoriae]
MAERDEEKAEPAVSADVPEEPATEAVELPGDDDAPERDAAPGDDADEDDDGPPPAAVAAAAAATPKRTVAGAMIGVLVGLLGFALVVQVQNNTTDPTLASARQADLLQILADLESRSQRLQGDIGDLETLKRELTSDAQGTAAALEQARKRADQLGILAGTLPAQGPGLTFTVQAKTEPIRAIDIVDVIQELRNAGAEAMQISGSNGSSVRIIVSTYFADASGSLNVDGQTLTGPYVITAIGDPSTMDKALRIPGGPVALVTSHGGNVIVGEPGTVTVTTLHAPATLEYAEPVS